jgi:hypothetical protein
VNPDLYPFFDLKTGKALTEITQDFAPTSDHLRIKSGARRKCSHNKNCRGRSARTTKLAEDEARQQQEQRRQQSVRMCDELAANPQ